MRPAALRRLADTWWARWWRPKPGSDLQLAYVRAFLLVADDDRIDGLLISVPSGRRGPASGRDRPVGAGDGGASWRSGRPECGSGPAEPACRSALTGSRPGWSWTPSCAGWCCAGWPRSAGPTSTGSTRSCARTRPRRASAQHAAALAARPLPAAKEQAFALLTEQAELTNDLARAVAAGFWQRGQEDLLRPWAGALLRRAAGDLGEPGAGGRPQITRLLYPRLDEPGTLVRTDAFLAATDMPAGCRRTSSNAATTPPEPSEP